MEGKKWLFFECSTVICKILDDFLSWCFSKSMKFCPWCGVPQFVWRNLLKQKKHMKSAYSSNKEHLMIKSSFFFGGRGWLEPPPKKKNLHATTGWGWRFLVRIDTLLRTNQFSTLRVDDFSLFWSGRGVACDRNFWSLVTAIFGRLWPHQLLRCHFSWQAQYSVMLECQFSWQAHYLVMLDGQFLWQAQHLVKFG